MKVFCSALSQSFQSHVNCECSRRWCVFLDSGCDGMLHVARYLDWIVAAGRVGWSVTALPRFRGVVDIVLVVLVILTDWKCSKVERGEETDLSSCLVEDTCSLVA
jgi:hypothetical protein